MPNVGIFTGGGAFEGALFHLQHTAAAGVDGGTVTSGAYRTRPLNTVIVNDIAGASLSDDVITLPVGKYFIIASAQSYVARRCKHRLFSLTGNVALVEGQSNYVATIGPALGNSVFGQFSLNEVSEVELQMHAQDPQTGNGFGVSLAFDTNLYTDVMIWKVG